MQSFLEKIITNPDHVFNRLLDIKKDNKSICSFAGIDRVVHGEKDYLELVGRDIIVKSLFGENKKYYTEEKLTDDNKRSDLLGQVCQGSFIQNITEFKNEPVSNYKNKNGHSAEKDFIKVVNNAFSQISDDYIEDKYKEEDFFVTVIITDVETLYDDPTRIERFSTTPNEEKKNSPLSLFKECGLYIETRRFSVDENKILNEVSWNVIPNISIYETSKIKDESGQRMKKSKISDVISFPFSSSQFGIKNVRDVKDPEMFLPKKILVENILDTVFKAYEANDFDLIGIQGKEKDFLYIDEETIFQKIPQPSGNSQFIIVSMNGAIVDGQNSIDSFKIIKKIIESRQKKYQEKNEYNFEDLSSFELRLRDEITKKTPSESQLNSLSNFLDECYVSLKITKVKNVNQARVIAASKNASMLVSKSELEASKNYDRIQVISFNLFKKDNLILDYVKKENICITKKMLLEKGVHVSEASIYNEMKNNMKKTALEDTVSALKVFQEKETAKSIKNLCEEYSVNDAHSINEKENNSQNKKIEGKKSLIKELQSAITEINNNVMSLESLKSNNHEISKLITENNKKALKKSNEIENIEDEIKYINQRKKDSFVDYYKVNNQKEFSNLIKSILSIRKILDKKHSELRNITLFNEETIPRLIFTMATFKTENDFKETPLKESVVNKVLNNIIEGERAFKEKYDTLGLTNIRNTVEGLIVNSDNDNETTEDARKFLLNKFLK